MLESCADELRRALIRRPEHAPSLEVPGPGNELAHHARDSNAQARAWPGAIANVRVHGTTGEAPLARLPAEQAAMHPYLAPAEDPASNTNRWPRYPLQRSPREYDAVLAELAP